MDRLVVWGNGRDRGWPGQLSGWVSGRTEIGTAKFALKMWTYVRVGKTSVQMG